MIGLSGCATVPSALALLPVTGSREKIQVREYAIIEQSTDNPTHAEFQQRVKGAVTARNSNWHLPGPPDLVTGPNQSLASFGYRLEVNPSPPFSGFALYHDNHMIQRDIARFWPVSLKTGSTGHDFLLAFETMSGEKLVASADGIHPWANSTSSIGVPESRTPPVYLGDQVAYAESTSGEVSVYAGPTRLYSQAGSQASNLQTWIDTPNNAETDTHHWALEMDGQVIVDGKDLNQMHGYERVFNWHIFHDQPFYFYTRNGLVRLNYADHDLAFTYDQVVHGNTGETAMYNPGSTDTVMWFYALRDGLWYYVEMGFFK